MGKLLIKGRDQFSMSKTQIGIVIPSRGLMFSRTAEEIERETKGIRRKWYFAHGQPIPKCFESPVNRALCDFDNTHILIIEDDMKLHENAVWEALDADADVVTYDYPITKKGRGAVFAGKDGKPIFCGTGFLLIKREVFDKLKAPYFRSDIAWNIQNDNGRLRLVGSNRDNSDLVYGLHDVNFGIKLWKAGIPITVLEKTLGQRKLVHLGKSGSNDGAHKIEEWTKVIPNFQLQRYLSIPSTKEDSDLVTIETDDGEFMVNKEHAEKLVYLALARNIDPNKISIDDTGVEW